MARTSAALIATGGSGKTVVRRSRFPRACSAASPTDRISSANRSFFIPRSISPKEQWRTASVRHRALSAHLLVAPLLLDRMHDGREPPFLIPAQYRLFVFAIDEQQVNDIVRREIEI